MAQREGTGGHEARCSAVLLMVTLLAATLTPAPLWAQSVEAGKSGPRATLDRDMEIRLAASAAPTSVSEQATILVWTGDTHEVARRGTNGVTCYVARDWPDSLEPHCFDEEGSRTILPIHLRQMELRDQGRTTEEIDAEVARGLADGTFRLPTRPAMSYMMSAGQELVSDDGTPVGAWQPHLMIYYPYLTAEDMGLGPVPSTEAAILVDPGTPFSNVMIVVKEFVDVDTDDPERE